MTKQHGSRLSVRYPAGDLHNLNNYCKQMGITVTQFVKDALNEKMGKSPETLAARVARLEAAIQKGE